MIGMARIAKRRARVARALRYRRRSSVSCKVRSTWPATIPHSARARDHSLASAICPIAAEAWLSSSLSAPLGSPATVRPSAMAPEDTTMTLAPRSCSAAMSDASASSHARLTAPRAPSTRSDEPTLTTTRLNWSREGSFATIVDVKRGLKRRRLQKRGRGECFSSSAASRDGKATARERRRRPLDRGGSPSLETF